MAVGGENVNYAEEFILNSRGMQLFTCSWLPVNQESKALIFICHGYAMECSITMRNTAIRLVNAGYTVYGMDYEGHGKSSGLQAFVDNFDVLVDDCSSHFTNVCKREENRGKMRFLLGESMGGAVALLLHRKMPNYWNGAILSAPMLMIAEEMRPHPIVAKILNILCKWIPTWKVILSPDIVEVAIREPGVRQMIRENDLCYKGPYLVKTGCELSRVATDLLQRLNEVSLPFLVLHGEQDIVTDERGSALLFEVASSNDKFLRQYPGMWHDLLYGEPQHNTDIVFNDIITWLDKRAVPGI